MHDTNLRSIAIVGGGPAGWMAAATLSRLLKKDTCRIALIEKPAAPALGTGHATTPSFQRFNNLLGIDERDFVRKTAATFTLGTEFSGWSDAPFFHTFGGFGGVIAQVPFHHYWRKLHGLGDSASIEDYSIATAAAKLGRFTRPIEDARSVLSLFSHAYHFDAGLYADALRAYACARGVERLDRTVITATLRSADGFIESVTLDDGSGIEADFFIDCTGFPGLLHEQVLKTGIEPVGLPCDRAVSVRVPNGDALPPYARATTREAGWQWSLPMQTGTDHTYVYASSFVDDDAAATALQRDIGTPADVRLTRFTNGRPRKFWNRNCLSLPGGFLEPLEATAVHFVQTGILKLFGGFPDRTFNPSDSEEYNRLTEMEFDRIRDFLILHYVTATRRDTPFWKRVAGITVPDTLRHKIDLFRSSGRVAMFDNEHFGEPSWQTVFLGHGIVPERYDQLADVPPLEDVRRHVAGMADAIRQTAQGMPAHEQYLAQFQNGVPA